MPTQIAIPPRLNDLLEMSELAPAVRLSIGDFEGWIGDPGKGLFFFPEYTDHGPRHISAVLAAAEGLIREEAWRHLTSEDAAVLVLSALLHDSAMHLTADGLLDLIQRSGPPAIPQLDSAGWSDLFSAFFLEARRWDQKTLHRILGDQAKEIHEEEDLIIYIRHPREKPDPETWETRYRKFLGEFVRRHHGRLAHEIALGGVPGYSPYKLRLTRIPRDMADLAGIVARSHNMALRETFAYLKDRYSGRVVCRNSHVIFLMALLRIADYLELRADRVSSTMLKIQRLRSPISQEEWDAHLAVHEVRPDDEDREAVFIQAEPASAREFLKLQRLLFGLQNELDTTWAVLGEVYSRQEELAKLEMKLRRVKSNLADPDDFMRRQQPAYFPFQATFEAAGGELLKLLVRPLYGDRPEVGVRELLQNALDAVYERRQYIQGHPDAATIPQPDQEADVLISIDTDSDGRSWLTISDKGIGMTVATVREYFLRAGASYRTSDAWRQEFEEEGESIVLRSGHFGIGILAAFLLGEQVEVTTRHISEPEDRGMCFSASFDQQQIEIKRISKPTCGTCIRVCLSPSAEERLTGYESGWDWYTLEDPVVERRENGEKLSQRYQEEKSHSGWKVFRPKGYQAVWWSYSRAPVLSCNGLIINESERSYRTPLFSASPFKPPNVSVFDPDGLLPLNLQRDRLETSVLPFEADLLREVTSEFLAVLLVHSPATPSWSKLFLQNNWSNFWNRSYSHLAGLRESDSIYLTPEGSAFLSPWHLKKAQQGHILFLVHEEGETHIPTDCWGAWAVLSSHVRNNTLLSLMLDLIPPYIPNPKHVNLLITESSASLGYPAKGFKLASSESGWEIWKRSVDDQNSALPGVRKSVVTQEIKGIKAALELVFDPSQIEVPDTPFFRLLDELMDHPVIPYDYGIRQKKFTRAFDILRDRIAQWERADKLSGWQRDLVFGEDNGSEI
jgi:molecular chaperone HtpG